MKEKLNGLELEFLVMDKHGNIVNRSDDIINHPARSKYILKELAMAQVEVIADPAADLSTVESNFREQVDLLNYITSDLDLQVIPASQFGGEDIFQLRTDKPRYRLFAEGIGPVNIRKWGSACGTHIHRDHNDNIENHYNLFTAMDLNFPLIATSPYFRGTNSVNNGRYKMFRKEIMVDDLARFGQLQPYVPDMKNLHERKAVNRQIWLERLKDSEGAKPHFHEDDTDWSPVRTRDKTTETRNGDAAPLSLIMAMAALYKGVDEYVDQHGLTVQPHDSQDSFDSHGSSLYVPTHATVNEINDAGMRYGLRADMTYTAISKLEDMARQGLPEHELHYLRPHEAMLHLKRNMSDVLNRIAKSIGANGFLSSDQAREMNKVMARIYQDDLKSPSNTVRLLENGPAHLGY